MPLLLKNITNGDPGSGEFQQVIDVLIEDGIIRKIGKNIAAPEAKVLDGQGLWVMPSWFDLRCQIPEPGFEFRETFASAAAAAAWSGISGIAVLPDSDPVRDNRSGIAYVNCYAEQGPVQLYPLGTISQQRAGQDLAEIFDMHQAGALAFSEGNRSLQDAGLLKRALLYTRDFDALLMLHAQDEPLSQKGMVHEGIATTHLGLKGIPALAESLMIYRDLALQKEYGGSIHFSHISTAESVRLIRAAKAEGAKVSCDVALMSLLFTDEQLSGFDTRFKVLPPLRAENDRKALIAGLKDGTIDAIVTDHRPLDQEAKLVEFDYAAYGAATLQTAYAASLSLLSELSWKELYRAWITGPRKVVGLEIPALEIGKKAELSLFDPEASWELNEKTNQSLSKNSPWWGQTLQGQCRYMIQAEQIFEIK